jgi:hypothetical protein
MHCGGVLGLGHPQDACVVCYRRPGVSRERSWLAGVLLVLRNAEIKIYKAAYRHSYLRLYNVFFTPHIAPISHMSFASPPSISRVLRAAPPR